GDRLRGVAERAGQGLWCHRAVGSGESADARGAVACARWRDGVDRSAHAGSTGAFRARRLCAGATGLAAAAVQWRSAGRAGPDAARSVAVPRLPSVSGQFSVAFAGALVPAADETLAP